MHGKNYNHPGRSRSECFGLHLRWFHNSATCTVWDWMLSTRLPEKSGKDLGIVGPDSDVIARFNVESNGYSLTTAENVPRVPFIDVI